MRFVSFVGDRESLRLEHALHLSRGALPFYAWVMAEASADFSIDLAAHLVMMESLLTAHRELKELRATTDNNDRQTIMNLRFEVDQAECFRKGIDCPKSIVTIEVDPAKLNETERNLIADRLDGIDVRQLTVSLNGLDTFKRNHVIAKSPDYDGLIAAVTANQAALTQK